MDFFVLPAEIRLQIYYELLVSSEIITFSADFGPLLPPLSKNKRYGLCPALLRVSKRIHQEASPLLYSKNTFQFPDVITSMRPITESAHIIPFLKQIGKQASFIRHMRFKFPTFDDVWEGEATLHESFVNTLEAIRLACTGLRTVELRFRDELLFYEVQSTVVEAVEILSVSLQAIPTLKTVIVHIIGYGQRSINDDVRKKMVECGWSVKILQDWLEYSWRE